MPEDMHPKHTRPAPSTPPDPPAGTSHRAPRSRRRRWLSVGALTLAVVTGAGGIATADSGMPFGGMNRALSPQLTTRTTSAHGALTVSRTRCRFWFWCRPAPAPIPQPPQPNPTTPEPTDTATTSPDPTAPATAPAVDPTTTQPDPGTPSTPPDATSPAPAPPSKAPAPEPTTTPAPAPPTGDALAQQILDQLNAARAEAGAAPLTMSDGLVTSARKHTDLMAGGCGLSHQCSGEASLGDRISAAGVSWTSVGENIGYGGPVANTDTAIVGMGKKLTASMLAETPPNDGHRRNILNTGFHHVGIYLYRDANGTVWMTQDFSN